MERQKKLSTEAIKRSQILKEFTTHFYVKLSYRSPIEWATIVAIFGHVQK